MRLNQYQPKRARIEIVPMIDTIFFLLVFFMITSLALTSMRAMPVSLPKSDSATTRPLSKVVLTLTSEGQYFVDRQPVTLPDIAGILKQRLNENPSIAVVINCDGRQNVGKLVELADEAKRSGAKVLTIATRPKENSIR